MPGVHYSLTAMSFPDIEYLHLLTVINFQTIATKKSIEDKSKLTNKTKTKIQNNDKNVWVFYASLL